MSTTEIIPQQHDEAIAAKYHELEHAHLVFSSAISTLQHMAGATYYYRGTRRVTDMTSDEALVIVNDEIAKMKTHEAAHTGEESLWVGYAGQIMPYEKRTAEEQMAKQAHALDDIARIQDEIRELELAYTGWSRFFLVTSSSGHIHSSMHCSTCRATTSFGWMPQLSGKTEGEAVETCGPTLCSVCFPEAPLDWQSGKKLTKTQAAKLVA